MQPNDTDAIAETVTGGQSRDELGATGLVPPSDPREGLDHLVRDSPPLPADSSWPVRYDGSLSEALAIGPLLLFAARCAVPRVLGVCAILGLAAELPGLPSS